MRCALKLGVITYRELSYTLSTNLMSPLPPCGVRKQLFEIVRQCDGSTSHHMSDPSYIGGPSLPQFNSISCAVYCIIVSVPSHCVS